jgi:hypothetical protein
MNLPNQADRSRGDTVCTSYSATIPGMNVLADDLEDDSLDPRDIPTRDLTRPVRRLAAAVLVQAVLDSRLQAECHRQDAAQFLYPQSEAAREHLTRMAELAGLSPAWLNECLIVFNELPLFVSNAFGG